MLYISVFLEGLLSFISPCILPLIPLYMSYLAGASKSDDARKDRITTFISTLFFTLGISTVYFILGLASSALRDLIADYQNIITLVGGIILIILALMQLEIIEIKPLSKEHSFKDKVDVTKMNYFKAYLLGLVFSFAWTPCIGPMMANVLIMASTSEALVGNLLIVFYTLGLTIPFLVIALFYEVLLRKLKERQSFLIRLSKLAGVIILIFGLYMSFDAGGKIVRLEDDYRKAIAANNGTETTTDSEKFMMYGFELKDQYGDTHTLADYEGKYIALNFVASWCTYCINEIPDYEAFVSELDDDVVGLYVMADSINSQSSSMTTDEFIKEHDITVPVLYDDGTMFSYLNIGSFPTVVYIGPDGSYIGYQSGALDKDTMHDILDMAKERYEAGGES